MPCTIMGLCTRNSVRGVAEFFCNVEAKAHEKYAATIKFQYPQAGRERTLTLACPEGEVYTANPNESSKNAQRGKTMELIVEGKGSFLGKHQGRLRVMQERKTITEVPLIHLKQVIIVDGGVSISSDVIRTCSEEGIPIYFLSGRGVAIASLYSAGLTGTVMTRRAQLLAYAGKMEI